MQNHLVCFALILAQSHHFLDVHPQFSLPERFVFTYHRWVICQFRWRSIWHLSLRLLALMVFQNCWLSAAAWRETRTIGSRCGWVDLSVHSNSIRWWIPMPHLRRWKKSTHSISNQLSFNGAKAIEFSQSIKIMRLVQFAWSVGDGASLVETNLTT